MSEADADEEVVDGGAGGVLGGFTQGVGFVVDWSPAGAEAFEFAFVEGQAGLR